MEFATLGIPLINSISWHDALIISLPVLADAPKHWLTVLTNHLSQCYWQRPTRAFVFLLPKHKTKKNSGFHGFEYLKSIFFYSFVDKAFKVVNKSPREHWNRPNSRSSNHHICTDRFRLHVLLNWCPATNSQHAWKQNYYRLTLTLGMHSVPEFSYVGSYKHLLFWNIKVDIFLLQYIYSLVTMFTGCNILSFCSGIWGCIKDFTTQFR